jgi:hypothetical protein
MRKRVKRPDSSAVRRLSGLFTDDFRKISWMLMIPCAILHPAGQTSWNSDTKKARKPKKEADARLLFCIGRLFPNNS